MKTIEAKKIIDEKIKRLEKVSRQIDFIKQKYPKTTFNKSYFNISNIYCNTNCNLFSHQYKGVDWSTYEISDVNIINSMFVQYKINIPYEGENIEILSDKIMISKKVFENFVRQTIIIDYKDKFKDFKFSKDIISSLDDKIYAFYLKQVATGPKINIFNQRHNILDYFHKNSYWPQKVISLMAIK
jgi:hypothetical protein